MQCTVNNLKKKKTRKKNHKKLFKVFERNNYI